MKSWKELAGAVCLLALLGGCGIKHGVVTAKNYHASYTYYTDHCVSYDKNNACKINMPMANVEPEHYELDLRDPDKDDTGSVYVDAITWHKIKIGDRY